ncbi:site-specific DNA-methyltransferase [Legionella pneumophila serogroup 1]
MSEAYKKLIKTLQNIFEMDKADLDFGIYRIMNQKRDEINKFLNEDLLPQVKKAFEDFTDDSNKQAHDELKKLIKTLEDAGMDPDSSPKVLELKKQISNTVDITALENDVFSKLHTFFSRYYDKGDFISQRRYKPNTYAIPYEGEEVKLYWANHDQYYIKSSEHLRDYAFIAKDGQDNDQPFRIKLVEADTEKDNIKAKADEERRFVLNEDKPLSIENGELIIHFNYIPVGKKDQKKLNEDAVKTIFKQTDKEFTEWLHILKKPAPTEKNKDRTLLEKHIHSYTARNTFDYFIHKNLGDFLRRELDFFIKNEVLHLDDIEDNSFELTEQQLRKIKILRTIAHKIIRFLAQIEDFQKNIWLKKKFIVETNYCITLNQVPHELIPEVMTNNNQIIEWQELFAIDIAQLKSDFEDKNSHKAMELDKYKYLIVDTKYYGKEFKEKLLSSLADIDDKCNGLLINSDNSQALRLILSRYKEKIDCIYIDPPYNTSENAFLYKNNYKHSSWNTMMSNTLSITPGFMNLSGVIMGAIDDTEYASFKYILSTSFGNQNYIGTIAVEINPAGQNIRPNVPARSHDYFHIYAKNINCVSMQLRGLTAKEKEQYSETDDQGNFYWDNLRRRGGNSRPSDRPKQWFPLYLHKNSVRVPRLKWIQNENKYEIIEQKRNDEVEVWPIDPKGEKRIWRVNPAGAEQGIKDGEIGVIEKAGRMEVSKKSREPEGKKPKTLWVDSKYSATSYGSKLLQNILGNNLNFSYPKSINLTTDAIRYWSAQNSIVMDFFAGSGTTAHSVINLNREDSGNRKYILVEMGEYFNTVLIPRIKKIIYAENWQFKKPASNNKKTGDLGGISHLFKYIKLESYEDALNNLKISEGNQNNYLFQHHDQFREDYMLSYFLNLETTNSPSLLNIDLFEDPFNYKLNIATNSVGMTKPKTVDLIETFNYLIGLKVKTIDSIREFKIINGINPKNESVLIIWRKVKENDNKSLEEFMDKQGYNPRDTEFQHIYINGDHTL